MHLFIPESKTNGKLVALATTTCSHTSKKERKVLKSTRAQVKQKSKPPSPERVPNKLLLRCLALLRCKKKIGSKARLECLACATHSLTQSVLSHTIDDDEQDINHTFLGLLVLCEWTYNMYGYDYNNLIKSRVFLSVWRILCTERTESDEEAEERRQINNDPVIRQKTRRAILATFKEAQIADENTELTLCHGCYGVGVNHLQLHLLAVRFIMLISHFAATHGKVCQDQFVRQGGLHILLWICHHQKLSLPSNLECSQKLLAENSVRPCAISEMQSIVSAHVRRTYNDHHFLLMGKLYKNLLRKRRLKKAEHLLSTHYGLDTDPHSVEELTPPWSLIPKQLDIPEAKLYERLVQREKQMFLTQAAEIAARKKMIEMRVANSLSWVLSKFEQQSAREVESEKSSE